MITISSTTLAFVLGTITLLSALFAAYAHFRNPQIKTDQTTTKLKDDVADLQKQILEIKETHLRAVESDLKNLTTAVNDLGKTVIRLSTIIDERIPKGSPGLTPPGA